MINDDRILIKPTDWLFDIDEIPDGKEPRSRCRMFIEPYGPFELNEVGEANYYPGNRVPYHEHTTGYETFLVDNGSLEVFSRSRKAIAHKGDLVHLAPYTPHAIRALEDNTIWRAFHQGSGLEPNMLAMSKFREQYPELANAPDFRSTMPRNNNSSVWFDYILPECVEVPASEFTEIRTPEEALAEFNFEKLNMKLKVGKWETGGAKEVWQLNMKSGCSFSWIPFNIFPFVFDIYDGEVEVKLDGKEPFKANTRDLLHIPKYLGGSITALKDTVLLDMGCQGSCMRYLDEVNWLKANEPDKLKDASFLDQLMRKYNYFIQFKF